MQYRMCQDIMDLSNALVYGDRLRCGSVEVANAKLEFSGLSCDLPWLEHVRSFFFFFFFFFFFLSGFLLYYGWRIFAFTA